MSFEEEVKNMSNKELIDRIRGCSCNSYYRAAWKAAINELEIRLGAKSKEIEEAIEYFNHGISHDIFSEEMIRVAEISIEALERMKDGL